MKNLSSTSSVRNTPPLVSPKHPFDARRAPALEYNENRWQTTPFNRDYVRLLREGDWETQRHFTRYFGALLTTKVQSRVRAPQLREEVRQETLLRVLIIVRRDGVEHPERLGGLVNSICEHVLKEVFRKESRTSAMPEIVPEIADRIVSPELILLLRQRESQVRRILARLPSKDRQLLEQIFLEERDKDEVCRTLQVNRSYLRVMLHRAKARFRQTFWDGVDA
jgi:RNA polymerase sigma-70 factor (ECF subfamily)